VRKTASASPKSRRRFLRALPPWALALVILLPRLGTPQETSPKDRTARFEVLLKEMDAAVQSGGLDAFKAWTRIHAGEIDNDFIVFIALGAGKPQSEGGLRTALFLASEKGNLKAEADVLFYAGQYYSRISRTKEALDAFGAAEPLYIRLNDILGLGCAYQGEGDIRSLTGDIDAALVLYEKALPLFEKAQSLAGQGYVYRGEGAVHYYRGETAAALALYEKAMPFFEKALDPTGQGAVLKAEGDIYYQRGENDKALATYEKALGFYEKASSPAGRGSVYKAVGDIHFQTGENAKALDMYEKALPLFLAAQDPVGQGNVYKSEGDVFQYTGEKAKALAMYERARPLYERAQALISLGNLFQAEGDIFQYAGDDPKALALYEGALRAFEKAQLSIGQGIVYQREGDLYLRSRDPSRALAMYEKALPFFEKAQEPVGQGNICQREGEAYFQIGESAKALAMYEKALPFFEKAQERSSQGYIWRAEADLLARTGENVKALAMYEKAVAILDKFGDPEGLAAALFGRAGVFAAQGRKAEALDLYEKALATLEGVRARTALAELKTSFMRMEYQDYEKAALFMLGSGYAERGFRVVESMKARGFLDTLAEGLANVDKGLAPALRDRRDSLIARLSASAKAAVQSSDSGKLQALREERDKLQAELDALQMEIRLKNPAYAAVRYPEPVGLAELQRVLRPKEVLVEYYLAEEKAYAFTATAGSFKAIELPRGSKAIRAAVGDYLPWISDPRAKGEDEKKRVAAGEALYALLIEPIAATLAEGSTLLIVPDDALARLPFESLVQVDPATKHPSYLLESYPIKYFQSASVLSFLRTQLKQTGVTDTFIGFGDPVYDYASFVRNAPEAGMEGYEASEDLTKGRFVRAGGSLKRLEHSGEEVREIAAMFRNRAQERLRQEATEENAKASSMAGYGYIHFSCHGLLGDGFQALVLSQIPGEKEDGFLTLGEIMACSYNARLVVLSACETGKGQEERGEGVTGLTRAVMYAGTPAAAVSLWSVSDAATRDLMVRFYRLMIAEGAPKDEALRRAKLEMLRNDQRVWITRSTSIPAGHPFFWAAFVMYGE
jgi:CHAT domain-containing protein/predicted negative regulator of RcsB-dependent stress response